ncbi:MAG TPA: sigma-70 family RNA polymerase sigma factor [Vicinamibacteria bacterium]|nr:sigma-70 family RNA polymerase sigma factor [Vicinamibacteria bacterium]
MSATAVLPFPLLLPSLAGSAGEPLTSAAAPAMQQSDRALVERTARGDADAFTILYRRYERPVFGVLLRLAGGRRALAEEWLQEAFTRVWLAAGTHDPSRGEVRPWIYKIALNTARSELARKRYRTPHVSLDESGLDLPDEGAGEKGVAARLDEARRAEAVALAVRELPDFMREVIVLRCRRELTFAEIAEVTGAPEGTLKSRFHRAVAALREAVARPKGEGR